MTACDNINNTKAHSTEEMIMRTRTEIDRRKVNLAEAAFVSLVLCLLIPAAARAQWTSSGNNINNTNTGYVGVGTNTPVGRLDVRQIGNTGLYATILTSYGTNEDTFIRGGGSSAVVHIGDLASTTAKLALMENGGSVGIGTATPGAGYKLDVNGNTNITGTLNATGTITGGNIAAKYQDVAEWVPTGQKLSAGTVVVLDSERANHVLASTSSYDTKVAGVVSARPGIALGEEGEGKVLVATTGRVRVKVDARRSPIKVGDLLVTSDVEGIAMKSEPFEIAGRRMHAPGTIIGKALEPLDKGTGEILVLLSMQ
jgi:hypothetical protein